MVVDMSIKKDIASGRARPGELTLRATFGDAPSATRLFSAAINAFMSRWPPQFSEADLRVAAE
jgi:hypothetical protein